MGVPYGLMLSWCGLGQYNHLVWEGFNDLGAQAAVGGGGRYNKLVEQLGGHNTPAAGLA